MAGLLSASGPDQAQPFDMVAAELRRWARLPFIWGKTDCWLSVTAYVERLTGKNLPHPGHHSALDAARILRAAGGYAEYCRRAMEVLGCPPTEKPQRGDVGLVDIPGIGLTFCICLGALWAARGDRRLIIMPASHVLAWEVSCPRSS